MPRRRRALPRNIYRPDGSEALFARLTVAGRDFRRCLHTSDVQIARQRLKDLREQLNAEIRYGAEDRRWEAVFVAWSEHIAATVSPTTAARYAVSLDQVRPWLSGRRLDEIDKRLIGDLVRGRQSSGATVATIRRDLTAISSVLEFTIDQGWREEGDNPALARSKRLKERRDPIALPRPEDVASVIAESGAMSALIRAARATGARQDELLKANRADLDPVRKALMIRRKGNKLRALDVSICWDLFAALPAGIASAALFPNAAGGRWVNVASRFAGLTRRISRHAAKVGRPFRRFRFHDLRHLFAVEYLRSGGSIYDLQQHLGHGSVKVTEMYLAFLTPEEADRAKFGARTALNRDTARRDMA